MTRRLGHARLRLPVHYSRDRSQSSTSRMLASRSPRASSASLFAISTWCSARLRAALRVSSRLSTPGSGDSILDLVQNFVHAIDVEDVNGKVTGKKKLVFPRFHQLKAVRELVDDARENGAGQHYLIQHSAGSGKSNTIAWLAHRLTTLHDSDDKRVFDTIVVVTDRRVLDRQLQKTIRSFEKTVGLVENIDQGGGKHLKQALEEGKQIIVTTLQKFPVIVEDMQELPGHRFAVIIDEAHSSTSGEQTKDLKKVLAVSSLEAAENEESAEPEDLEDRIIAEMQARGRVANASFFAFTATPKPKTLELFGVKLPDGQYQAFSLHSMRQAIEEKFILDVLRNYTTYKTYWRLLKIAESDPHYDHDKASYLLRSFVDLHEHTIRQKVEIMVGHFRNNSAGRIGGRAKAMIVTRSRLHAVRYKLILDAYLKEQGYPYKALVAFSGTVHDAHQRGGRVRLDSSIRFLGDRPLVMQLSVPSVV
jgi:type I restriction enzyme, R subunit